MAQQEANYRSRYEEYLAELVASRSWSKWPERWERTRRWESVQMVELVFRRWIIPLFALSALNAKYDVIHWQPTSDLLVVGALLASALDVVGYLREVNLQAMDEWEHAVESRGALVKTKRAERSTQETTRLAGVDRAWAKKAR